MNNTSNPYYKIENTFSSNTFSGYNTISRSYDKLADLGRILGDTVRNVINANYEANQREQLKQDANKLANIDLNAIKQEALKQQEENLVGQYLPEQITELYKKSAEKLNYKYRDGELYDKSGNKVTSQDVWDRVNTVFNSNLKDYDSIHKAGSKDESTGMEILANRAGTVLSKGNEDVLTEKGLDNFNTRQYIDKLGINSPEIKLKAKQAVENILNKRQLNKIQNSKAVADRVIKLDTQASKLKDKLANIKEKLLKTAGSINNGTSSSAVKNPIDLNKILERVDIGPFDNAVAKNKIIEFVKSNPNVSDKDMEYILSRTDIALKSNDRLDITGNDFVNAFDNAVQEWKKLKNNNQNVTTALNSLYKQEIKDIRDRLKAINKQRENLLSKYSGATKEINITDKQKQDIKDIVMKPLGNFIVKHSESSRDTANIPNQDKQPTITTAIKKDPVKVEDDIEKSSIEIPSQIRKALKTYSTIYKIPVKTLYEAYKTGNTQNIKRGNIKQLINRLRNIYIK